MKKRILLFLLGISSAGLLMTSCSKDKPATSIAVDSTATFDLVAVRKIIDEKNIAFAKAFVSRDSATMVNQYTINAKIFPPNAGTVAGRDAIAVLFQQYLKFGVKEFRDEITNFYGNEDNVIEEGNYFMGDGKGNIMDKGKYIDVWRKEDGDWKKSSNIWNTSVPTPPAK